MSSVSDLVRLNVGGKIFCTSSLTLLWPGKDTFFAGLLNGDGLPACLDASGAYFIDRDPEIFATVLEYLRTRRVHLPPSTARVSMASLRHEAQFYGLDVLKRQLDVCGAGGVDNHACGGILFSARLTAPPSDDGEGGPVVAVTGLNSVIAVAQAHIVTCWQVRLTMLFIHFLFFCDIPRFAKNAYFFKACPIYFLSSFSLRVTFFLFIFALFHFFFGFIKNWPLAFSYTVAYALHPIQFQNSFVRPLAGRRYHAVLACAVKSSALPSMSALAIAVKILLPFHQVVW